MLKTKLGYIDAPTTPITQEIFTWLKDNKALDGSNAFEEMIRIYETLEFDFGKNKKLVG